MMTIEDFLKKDPELLKEYIEYVQTTIRKRAAIAWEQGKSLAQYEKELNDKLLKELENLKNENRDI
jgi:hypothetical protein